MNNELACSDRKGHHRGMEGNTQRWQDVIGDRQRPALLRRSSGCPFVQGSKVYHALQSGGFSFRMYCFAKGG
jgi:hypothetical protein